MPEPPAPDVTRLLLAWREGDNGALDQLAPLVYKELRKLARLVPHGHPRLEDGEALAAAGASEPAGPWPKEAR